MAQKTIESDSSGTRALRGVADHFVRKAVKRLQAADRSDAAVHDARKDLKKMRAVVRLLRKALGESAYRRENAVLREAAHALNAARDATVLLQTLESLRREHRQLRHNAAVLQVARALEKERSATQQQLRKQADCLGPSRRALKKVAQRVGHWSVGKHGWSVLGPALKRIYKTGRRAIPAASVPAPDSALHEWRKQVKYLRYALQILAPMRPRELPALAQQAQGLSDSLGEAHDLALLAQKVKAHAQRRNGQAADVEALLGVIARRHTLLANNALVAGEHLYRASPRELERRLGQYWRQWRNGDKRPRSARVRLEETQQR